MRRLIIGNRCYSSWSLRPWLLMRTLRIPFEETQILLDRPETKEQIRAFSPAGRVPVLLDDDGVAVWESLAIMEHLAETVPGVWPEDPAARAMARSIAAEMHAEFQDLRREYPMNLGKRYAYVERPAAASDLRRIHHIVTDAQERFGSDGRFLFGPFSAADAMYAPVMARLDTYSIPVAADVRTYMDAVFDLPAYQEWREQALQEQWVLEDDEVDWEPLEDLRAPITATTDRSIASG